jgi:hypothetical protein
VAASVLKTGLTFDDAISALGVAEVLAFDAGDASAVTEGETDEPSNSATASVGFAEGAGVEEVFCADFCSQAASIRQRTVKRTVRGSFIRTTYNVKTESDLDNKVTGQPVSGHQFLATN